MRRLFVCKIYTYQFYSERGLSHATTNNRATSIAAGDNDNASDHHNDQRYTLRKRSNELAARSDEEM
ncbi:hypothetical protein AMI01nite_20620 [Aneurinibacillus migulanus]|nr:hypothetical protein AMI01nite_20620 [Aneurinibacillus migulanus]